MADLLCPACGKPNPDHLTECQFCRARLDDAPPPGPGDNWQPSPPSGEAEEELPDWLLSLSDEPVSDVDETDWLNRIRGDDFAATDPGQDEGLWDEPAAEPDSPEWPQEAAIPASSAELLSRIGADDAPQPPSEPEEIPDWLADLEPPVASDPHVPAPHEPPSTGETPHGEALPDWLSEFAAEVEREPEPTARQAPEPGSEEEQETWFAGFVDPPADRQMSQEEASEEEWLAGFEATTPAPRGPGPVEEEIPGWPAGLPDEGLAPGPSDEDDDLPPWLNEFASGQPAGEAETGEEIPAWLASALGRIEDEDDAAAPEAAAQEIVEPEAEEQALPDWLSQLPAGGGPEPHAEADEMPDWLMDASAQSPTPAAASEEIPDWLKELEQKTPSIGPARERDAWALPSASDAEQTDAIEWLPGQSENAALSMLPGEETFEEELEPGEIPEWLKAMRLIDASTPGTMEAGEIDAGAVERLGPLAGLRGVLSAEPYAAQAGKPPAYTIRLEVSDPQQIRADQLQKMVAGETESRPAGRKAVFSEQRVLRYIIALMLFLAAVLPGMLPGRLSPLPPRPPEMSRLAEMISGLTPESAVLVVFDYQPGMSGELDAAAASVLDHVMLQQARLAFVATHPTGPALAERFVRVVEAGHNYAYGTQYVNLGYIPGEAAGLQVFGRSPRSLTPLAYDARPVWSVFEEAAVDPWLQPALQGVQGLSDFRMTVLISDDADAVRRWIEQAGPHLPAGSLVVIASAQIEALVRPYYDAANGQVAALVPGLLGGAAYEGFLQREGPARAAWDAVGVGSLVAITLILGAGTYNLFLAWNERSAARTRRR